MRNGPKTILELEAIVEALTDADAHNMDDQFDDCQSDEDLAALTADIQLHVPYILVRNRSGWQRVTVH